MMRKIGGFLTIALLSLTLAACGGNSSADESSNSEKEITFWNPFTGPDGKNMQKMVDEYNKTNPEYKVKNVSLKEGDMYTKIPTVVNSGKNIPDVTIVHAERIKQYVDNEMLTSYEDYLGDYPEINSDNYVSEAWNIGDLNDTRYSLPLDIHTFGLYYNKDLVNKYLPTALDDNIVTFDEVQEIGELAKKDKIAGIGVTWVKPNFLSLYAQNGGALTEDGSAPTLDNEAARESFELWNEMFKNGITSKDGEDPLQLFMGGKLVFLPEGIWMNNTVKEAKFDYGITNAVQLSDDKEKMVNWSSSHQFVLFNSEERNDEKTKGVVAFVDWIRENSIEWARSGQNPATLSILENEEYKEMPQSFFVTLPEEQASLKIFDYKYNGYVSEYLDAHGFEAVFGKVKSDDAVKGMQKEIEDKISKDKTNN